MGKHTEEQYRAAAGDVGCTYDMQVDGDAKVSTGLDPGAWVQVWVWVPDAWLSDDVEED